MNAETQQPALVDYTPSLYLSPMAIQRIADAEEVASAFLDANYHPKASESVFAEINGKKDDADKISAEYFTAITNVELNKPIKIVIPEGALVDSEHPDIMQIFPDGIEFISMPIVIRTVSYYPEEDKWVLLGEHTTEDGTPIEEYTFCIEFNKAAFIHAFN